MAKPTFARRSLIFFVLIYTIAESGNNAGANKCDEEMFYRPYILVKRKKNGGDIASLRSSGFLDLRFKNRVILCINGPVVIYSDVERIDPESRLQPGNDMTLDTLKEAPEARNQPPDHLVNNPDGYDRNEEELRFRKAEVAVFNHQCISVNKVPTDVLKKMKEDQGKSNPELMPDTQVMGRLVLGIYLIGSKEGFNQPELVWFKGPNYEYIKTKEKTVKDSSFITTATNYSHCMRLPDGTHIKIKKRTPIQNAHEVCRWTVKEEDKSWYSKLFQRGYDTNGVRNGDPTLEEGDYESYECPDGDPDRSIILTMSKTTPPPISHINFTEFDPFSLFNPNLWTPHGYRKDTNGLSGGDERAEDRDSSGGGEGGTESPACSVNPSSPGCSDSGEAETTTLRDMQNVDPVSANSYEIYVSDCIALPAFELGECNGMGNNACRLLELTLELDPAAAPAPADASAPPDPSGGGGGDAGAGGGAAGGAEEKGTFPRYKNLNDDPFLAWKMDFLNLVSDVFAQLCMPFRAEMPYTVARVFGWYVYKAHMYGEEMGRVGPPPPGPTTTPAPGTPPTPEAVPEVSPRFDKYVNKTDTWVILEKELERCREVSKKENNGKGLKFQWEIGDDSGKWKIPGVNGVKRRKKRSAVRQMVQPEYPTYNKKQAPALNPEDFDEYEEGYEEIIEINADTGEKILSRKKRSNKYLAPGKTLKVAMSEGNTGYARETIQEYRPKPDLHDPRADSAKYIDFPENIQHCWDPVEDPVSKRVVCSKVEDIFFYEDRAEIEFELNIVIDLWWKIWATVIGYCNKAYVSRKSETFPRLYNSKYDYFFDLVQKEWKFPEDNEDLKIIFSEYLTEESQVWLDTCLESAYINSNSKSYRPPRPMTISEDKKDISNYFEELPSFLYYRYHPEPTANI